MHIDRDGIGILVFKTTSIVAMLKTVGHQTIFLIDQTDIPLSRLILHGVNKPFHIKVKSET